MNRIRSLLLVTLLVIPITVYFFFYRHSGSLSSQAKQLDNLITTENIARSMKAFASVPHRAGTEANHAVGESIISELRAIGLQTSATGYDVALPQPGEGKLQFTYPVETEIPITEKILPEDPYSARAAQERPYFAYVPDSDAEGEVIYANFGDRNDYRYLKEQGILIAGKIALVRAQGICRGMKQQIAEEEGIAGLLLYPEPRDQGFRKAPYPQGPGINPWTIQRGSMLKFFLYPGEPGSNFADENAKTLPTVPALPISTRAAQLILEKLHGTSPALWKGWLSTTYGTGPGPARVRVSYKSIQKPAKIRNIFASLPGADPSEPAVMLSCHYDAWVYGASDPSSGATVILETARALNALATEGWRPKRNVVFAFWDAEEYGMIGSTRWVQENFVRSRTDLAAMLYVDSVRGPVFGGNVMPGLRGILDEVLTYFSDPNTEKPVSEVSTLYDMPGFSDDTIPFSNLAGVPVAQLNYGMHYPMYHSIYDNLSWMERFGDPHYKYTKQLAEILALYAIALTSEDPLPFRFSEVAAHYGRTLSKLHVEQGNEEEVKSEFERTIRVVKNFEALAVKIESSESSSVDRQKINRILLNTILSFTEPPGNSALSFGRRNVLVGPSPENECAGIELPAVARAISDETPERVLQELTRVQIAFERARKLLEEVDILIRQAPQ